MLTIECNSKNYKHKYFLPLPKDTPHSYNHTYNFLFLSHTIQHNLLAHLYYLQHIHLKAFNNTSTSFIL